MRCYRALVPVLLGVSVQLHAAPPPVTTSDWGTIGLLQTPTARMSEAGERFLERARQIMLLTEEAVARYCRDNLTGYKQPKYIEFRDELPKSNVGKILRRELRTNTH